MLDKLISCCVPKYNQKLVTDLISNEEFKYVEYRHKTQFIDIMWNIRYIIQIDSILSVFWREYLYSD